MVLFLKIIEKIKINLVIAEKIKKMGRKMEKKHRNILKNWKKAIDAVWVFGKKKNCCIFL